MLHLETARTGAPAMILLGDAASVLFVRHLDPWRHRFNENLERPT